MTMKSDNRGSASYKVCSECGITHSPLWRGGPLGPKTMCNACGIRWKRANQAHHKSNKIALDSHYDNTYAQRNHKDDYLFEEEYDEGFESSEGDDNDSMKLTPEGAYTTDSDLIINDVSVSPFADSSSKKSSKANNRRKTKASRKLFSTSPIKSKPYTRPTDLVKKTAPLTNEFHVNCPDCESEAEISMILLQEAAEEYDRLDSELPEKERMEQLYHEVLALRQEVEKKDAVIHQLEVKNEQAHKTFHFSQPARERSTEGERSSSAQSSGSTSPSQSPAVSPMTSPKSNFDGKSQFGNMNALPMVGAMAM